MFRNTLAVLCLGTALLLAAGNAAGQRFGVGAPAAAAAQPAGDPLRPNVIFIMADDLGYGELGCYGQEKIRTPHLDQMAAEGLKFTQFYATPICAPSRCVLMTGKHLGHAAIRDNPPLGRESRLAIPASEVTVAEIFKQWGYATAAMGKWGVGAPRNPGDPNEQGFNLFLGYYSQRLAHSYYPRLLMRNGNPVELRGNNGGPTGEVYSHDVFEAEALRFIRTRRDRPFFLYLPFTIPHMAMEVPDDSLAEYVGQWPDPPYRGGNGYHGHPAPRAAYAGMVTRMDRSVGRIRALLAELGLTEKTLICFVSDNGPASGRVGGTDSVFFESAAGLRGLKESLYEGGVRVPFIACWPGTIAPGGVTDHVAALWDVLPTACDLVGSPVPAGTDGISFLPTLLGQGEQREHDHLYWELPGYGGIQSLRLRKTPDGHEWKAIAGRGRGRRRKIELYDLASDPGETRDLAASRPGVVAQIRDVLTHEHGPAPRDYGSDRILEPPPPPGS